jgi:menaquinone-dependent protoporphyrinogen oxidase
MKKIIIYASKYGCTEKAVKLLKSKIPGETITVNATSQKVPDLSSFDTVILGGPIYIGRMHKALYAYMQKNLETLKNKRLALFVCAGEQEPAALEKEFIEAFPEELYRRAILRESFGGELHLAKVDPVTKLILRAVKGIKEDYSRLSEPAIESFAKEV